MRNTYIPNIKRLSHSYKSKHHIWYYYSFVAQDYCNCVSATVDFVFSTSWVSNIGVLVLVLFSKFIIIKCGGFWMLQVIANNFLKIGNSWAIVKKYAPNAVFVGAHFFPQFLENVRFRSYACSTFISSKKHAPKFEKDW